MTTSEFLAKLDNQLRPFILLINPWFATFVYSYGRKFFLQNFSNEIAAEKFVPPPEFKRKLWDIEFQLPLFNAAGMFKKAEGYYTVASQGAGAYLAGTATFNPRKGNQKKLIRHPFLPYHSSKSASNWMGLPNEGVEVIAKRLSKIEKIKGCPVGVSLSLNPETELNKSMKEILDSLVILEKANVDFIEINESCPNINHSVSDGIEVNELNSLFERLEFICENYLKIRKRYFPLIIKFSNDTTAELLPILLDKLIEYDFDGVNFGNSSTKYSFYHDLLDKYDEKNFDYFVSCFKGGLSGNILKKNSLELATNAVNYINTKELRKEFNVIRTGGVDCITDILESDKSGIQLNQWFTGYFANFAGFGHQLYKRNFLS